MHVSDKPWATAEGGPGSLHTSSCSWQASKNGCLYLALKEGEKLFYMLSAINGKMVPWGNSLNKFLTFKNYKI